MSQTIRTHKEIQNYANDYTHDWPTTSVPRKPEFFQPVPPDQLGGWSKFVQMVKERRIPWETVGNIIRNGNVYRAEGRNRYRFLWTDPETLATFSLIVELRAEAFAYDDVRHYAVTVYRVQR
ncbi:hypothetical protein [Halorubrum halodurans]|uniref:Uncharacterized protein n=1 Tax=Halorubrum halodurans TaxID=1383851 RepID=A0A256IPJ8_9EURY|nr:hypothetical protein [Halorubrum halodurans]OYR58500.1 hypothetical protein DJ70_02990 [Halorubrum halodurans]